MDEQERRPLTLVDVVDRAALDLDPAAFTGNHFERDPLRERTPTGALELDSIDGATSSSVCIPGLLLAPPNETRHGTAP